MADHQTVVYGNNLPFLADQRIVSINDSPDRFATHLAFGLRKGSEFKEIFNYQDSL